MSEVASLVSWDQAVEQGKIPGSDWVRPTAPLGTIGKFERSGGIVTDEVITELAGGHPQHLEMTAYPEGYQAVKIVDSETGRVMTESRHASSYGGLISCNCGAFHNVPSFNSVLSGRDISLTDGRVLSSVNIFGRGTESVIQPAAVSEFEPDYIPRIRTGAHVNPSARNLDVYTEGRMAAIEGGHVKLDVREKDATKVGAKLTAWVSSTWDTLGQINLELDATGQVERLMVCKDGFLKILGVRIDLGLKADNGYWGEIVDPKQQALVLDATAEAFGFGEKWKGLDLKLTASGLYAAMGQRNFDPSTILVPQS